MHGDITDLLLSLRGGRRGALDALLPLVYEHLRGMARRRLAGGAGDRTLRPTELVHEAFLKLFDQSRVTPGDRRHFYALAATAMRQIVVDHARRRAADKRGGGRRRVDLESGDLVVDDRASELLALDQALRELARRDERLARGVELRYFGGLTVDETAEVLELDPRTVTRDWRKARAILHRLLEDDPPAPA